MMKVLSLVSFLALASGIACADSITTGTFESVPSNISSPGPGTSCGSTTNCGFAGTGPYWDNDSGKGSDMNIGYFLTGTGGYSDDTVYCPLATCQYLSSGSDSGYSAPSNIALNYTSGSPVVTLLADTTMDRTLSFGYYNTSIGASSETQICGTLTPDDPSACSPAALALTSSDSYGFYLTRSCFSSCPAGDESGTVTLFSNPSLNTCTTTDTSCSTDQHFTIFDSTTNPGVYYVSIEDWGLLGGAGNGEGNGDFNDVVFELNTGQSAVPEPASLGLIGAGLLGLGLARFRARRNRA